MTIGYYAGLQYRGRGDAVFNDQEYATSVLRVIVHQPNNQARVMFVPQCCKYKFDHYERMLHVGAYLLVKYAF